MTARSEPDENMRAQLAEAIGNDLADRLIARLGGTRQYVPRKPVANHPITVVLGAEGAALLASWAGGGSIDIPMRNSRRLVALDLISRGALTVPEIAVQASLCERQVYRIKKSAAAEVQPDLFDYIR